MLFRLLFLTFIWKRYDLLVTNFFHVDLVHLHTTPEKFENAALLLLLGLPSTLGSLSNDDAEDNAK